MTPTTLDDMFDTAKNRGPMDPEQPKMGDVFQAASKEGRLLPMPAFSTTNKTYIAVDQDKSLAFLMTIREQKNNACEGSLLSVNAVLNMLSMQIEVNADDLNQAIIQEVDEMMFDESNPDMSDEEKKTLLEQRKPAPKILSDDDIFGVLQQRKRIEDTIDILREHVDMSNYRDPLFEKMQDETDEEIFEMVGKMDRKLDFFAHKVDILDYSLRTLNKAVLDSTEKEPEETISGIDKTKEIARSASVRNTTIFFNRN